MAIVNPKERASVTYIPVKHFNGVGISTLRNQVPALTSSSPKIVAARAPATVPPSLTTRTAQSKPGG
jgi:hypothetical protein